jgi:hypothetical protein
MRWQHAMRRRREEKAHSGEQSEHVPFLDETMQVESKRKPDQAHDKAWNQDKG